MATNLEGITESMIKYSAVEIRTLNGEETLVYKSTGKRFGAFLNRNFNPLTTNRAYVKVEKSQMQVDMATDEKVREAMKWKEATANGIPGKLLMLGLTLFTAWQIKQAIKNYQPPEKDPISITETTKDKDKDQGGEDQGGKDQGGKDQGGEDEGGKDQGGHTVVTPPTTGTTNPPNNGFTVDGTVPSGNAGGGGDPAKKDPAVDSATDPTINDTQTKNEGFVIPGQPGAIDWEQGN